MATEPSFGEAILLILGAGAFVMWVVSDVLEEQMLGKTRRERQKAPRAVANRNAKRRPAAVPAARVHRGS